MPIQLLADQKDDMIPVVLCGGLSSRMGEDKGLMIWNDKPMARSLMDLLKFKFSLDPFISIRSDQVRPYHSAFPDGNIVVDDTVPEPGGPLRGILSVHKKFPDQDLFIIACDMPMISSKIIDIILSGHYLHREKEIIVCKHQGHIQPLCGIYTHPVLHQFQVSLERGHLKDYSMMHLIGKSDSLVLELEESDWSSFLNLNQKNDLID